MQNAEIKGRKRTVLSKMHQIITADQMRLLENSAMESGRVTGLTLMRRAGAGVIAATLDAWPALASGAHHALILCGPGNNGGDGYVIACGLRQRGWHVGLCASRAPSPGGDAARAAGDWLADGGEILPLEACTDALSALVQSAAGRPVLVVDALLGIGQGRSTDAILAQWWQAHDEVMQSAPATRLLAVAVDLPTGYDCDTGQPLGQRPFAADLVVTFHARKPVHEDLDKAGVRTVVVPIGL